MNTILFEGCAPALVTPFKNGKVDFDAFGELIEYQITNGIKTLVILGTTSEASTLEFAEENEIMKFTKEKVKGRAKIIIGTGSNDTKVAVERSIDAKNMGADGLLVVTPYYNKCTQKGLVAHYKAITDAVQIPVIAYNVPGRTGFNMTPETVLELSKNPFIAGLKEASGNIAQIVQLAKELDGKMALYSGDDGLDYLFLALGAKGMISVTANVLPAKKVELFQAVKSGNFKKALEIHNETHEINGALFCEVNPIPVKAVLHHMGLCNNELRLPLTPIEPQNQKKVVEAFEKVK